jgi:hypothetical protein
MSAAPFARTQSAPSAPAPKRFGRNLSGEQLEQAKQFIADVAAGKEKMPAPVALPQPAAAPSPAPAGAAASPFPAGAPARPRPRMKEPTVTQRMREQLALLRAGRAGALGDAAAPAAGAAAPAPAGQTRHAPGGAAAPAGQHMEAPARLEPTDPAARLLARMGATADGWVAARSNGAHLANDLFAAGLPLWQHSEATAALDAYAQRHTGTPIRAAGSPYAAPSLAPAGQAQAGQPWWVIPAAVAGIVVVVGGGALAVAHFAGDEGHGATRAFAGHRKARRNPKRHGRRARY